MLFAISAIYENNTISEKNLDIIEATEKMQSKRF